LADGLLDVLRGLGGNLLAGGVLRLWLILGLVRDHLGGSELLGGWLVDGSWGDLGVEYWSGLGSEELGGRGWFVDGSLAVRYDRCPGLDLGWGGGLRLDWGRGWGGGGEGLDYSGHDGRFAITDMHNDLLGGVLLDDLTFDLAILFVDEL
jgi:hypothetical protein